MRVLPPSLIERADHTVGRQYRAIVSHNIFIIAYRGEPVRLRSDELWQNGCRMRSMIYYCESAATKGAKEMNKIFQSDEFTVLRLTPHK
jgi:hypothetical protein